MALTIPASAYGYFAGGGKDAAKGNDCLIGYEGIEARDVTLDGKKQVVTCTDCDPGCDHDGDSTANGSCTFQVGVCINQTIEGCTPSSALDKAKANGTVKGVKGSGGKIVIDVSQLLTGSECGAVVAVVTPINAKKREGSATLKLSALVKKNKAEGITKTRKDTDTLTYVCVRRPAGELCPVSTTTSSTMASTTTTTIVTSGAFPATGQTTCWNSAGTVIPCADTGHDGDVRAGAPLAYQDNGDGTVTDLNTGLMWEKLSDDGSVHDKDNVYTWDDAFAVKVATLNAGAGFAGHTDWRVPNVKELQSIVNYESVAPAVSAAFNTACAPACTVTTCSCTKGEFWSYFYWSSSTLPSIPSLAWIGGFWEGGAYVNGKGFTYSVRAVRGDSGSGGFPATGQTTCWNGAGTVIPCAGTGQDGDVRAGAPLAYQDNGDGTVTDLNTGLMWEKLSDDGSIHDKDDAYSWDDAFAVKVAVLNAGAGFAGHTDWRVPNVKELQSIVNCENVAPAVSVAFNTACAPGCTVTTCSCTASSGNGSSSTIASRPMSQWGVSMNIAGFVGCCGGSSVRAVRGGLVTHSGAGSAAGGRRGRLLRSLPQR